jgi:hypothetical protein
MNRISRQTRIWQKMPIRRRFCRCGVVVVVGGDFSGRGVVRKGFAFLFRS